MSRILGIRCCCKNHDAGHWAHWTNNLPEERDEIFAVYEAQHIRIISADTELYGCHERWALPGHPQYCHVYQ
jgi:hypothetical protein